MEKRFYFKKVQYRIKIDIKSVSNETYYFVDVFWKNKRIKKAHFIKLDNELQTVPNSSNHTFRKTEDDNDLLYAVKENLLASFTS